MNRRLALAHLATLGGLNGCGWLSPYLDGTDNRPPPNPLLPLDPPQTIAALWSLETGSGRGRAVLDLRPAFEDGVIVAVGHRGEVVAAEADSGTVRWRVDAGFRIATGAGLGGLTCVIAGSRGEVLAVNLDNGEERWRSQVSSEVLAPPQIDGGWVIVRSADGRFTAFDELTGQQRWIYSQTVPPLSLRGYGPPLLAGGLMFAGLDNGKLIILGVEDGVLRLERPLVRPEGRTEIDRLNDLDGDLQLTDRFLYAAAYQGDIVALDIATGAIAWRRSLNSDTGLSADESLVVATDLDDQIWGLDPNTGNLQWQQKSLRGRRLIAPTLTRNGVVVGDFEGFVHWLRREDGEIVARYRVDPNGFAGELIAIGQFIAALGHNGRLVVLGLRGQ